MENQVDFYLKEKIQLEHQALILKKKSFKISIFRLSVFLVTCFLCYLTFGNYPDIFIIAFLGFSLFTFLVLKNINLKRERNIVEEKIRINTTEIDVLNGKFHHLETGNQFINPTHSFSNDIDLFGTGSFFQYINRTVTKEGEIVLSKTLSENNIVGILDKQEALQELAKKPKWRQHFAALASLVSVKNKAVFTTNWILNYKAVFTKSITVLPKIFGSVSLLLITLISFSFLSFSWILIWFFVGLFITGRFIKKTNAIYTETDKIRETFKQYHTLLHEIEIENFESKILNEKQQLITYKEKKASVIVKEFAKILDAFDQRNNVIIAVVGNGLFLWELNNACRVEKWISNYKNTVQKWFEVVAFFDAQNSLANIVFNHPNFVFPKISESQNIIKATDIGHPLLKSKKRINNDFNIKNSQFFIVTGANMAGKSTFLRTVSLSIVMANCGLPVCANSFNYSPIKLITSMRTSDSLTEDESYFYSELKRLKFIVNQIEAEDYFIILDEILKGTNSKDKAIGSQKFIEKLTKSKSTGIIATHDVSLCELENKFPTIRNYYFDAEITNNELHFDYILKNGICKNMNASFLLKKMEIVD